MANLSEVFKLSMFAKGQKVKHVVYGECVYLGGTAFGEAIIGIHKRGKVVDRLTVKFEELGSI